MIEMKVLFLDVDGVLNCSSTREKIDDDSMRGVEQSKCEMVRRIIRETDCYIVVSSTWRRWRHAMNYLWRQLGREAKERFIGQTPHLESRLDSGLYSEKVRGDEIQAWLNEHPDVMAFAIVDDDADMAHLHPHLFRTQGWEGLTDEITQAIIERLNSLQPA